MFLRSETAASLLAEGMSEIDSSNRCDRFERKLTNSISASPVSRPQSAGSQTSWTYRETCSARATGRFRSPSLSASHACKGAQLLTVAIDRCVSPGFKTPRTNEASSSWTLWRGAVEAVWGGYLQAWRELPQFGTHATERCRRAPRPAPANLVACLRWGDTAWRTCSRDIPRVIVRGGKPVSVARWGFDHPAQRIFQFDPGQVANEGVELGPASKQIFHVGAAHERRIDPDFQAMVG